MPAGRSLKIESLLASNPVVMCTACRCAAEGQARVQVLQRLRVQRDLIPVAAIAGRGRPLGAQRAARRHDERTVEVVVRPRDPVDEANGRAAEVPARCGGIAHAAGEVHVHRRRELVGVRLGVGDGLDDVGEPRIRPHAVDGDVEVPAAQLVERADALKRRVEADFRIQGLVDAAADTPGAPHLHVRPEQVAVGRGDRSTVAGIRVGRVDDEEIALAQAVDAQRLLVGVGVQPVIEEAKAGAEGGASALERGPGGAHARTEIAAVLQVRLDLVAHTGAQRQALADADVVLHVDAGLRVEVLDERIADALGIGRGRAGVEGVDARERVGAEPVRRVVRPVVAAGHEEARADGVQAAHVVHVGRHLEQPRMPSARHLRAAAGERAVHDHGRHVALAGQLPRRRQPSADESGGWVTTVLLGPKDRPAPDGSGGAS
jgi:hypothetical protein